MTTQLITLPCLRSQNVRRIKKLALESYKIINKEGPKFLHERVNLKHCNYSFRYSIAVIPNVKTNRYGINPLRYTSAKLWNDLPDNLRLTSSFGMFRRLITVVKRMPVPSSTYNPTWRAPRTIKFYK